MMLASSAMASAGLVTMEVDVDGLRGQDAALVDNVELFLKPPDRPMRPASIRRLHRQVKSRVEQALRPFGYYQPSVDAELVFEGDEAIGRYVVTLGPRIKVVEVDIRFTGDGRELPALLLAEQEFALRPGVDLDHRAYEKGKQALLNAANRGGYLDAKFTRHELAINPKTQQAWVRLDLQTGPRYRFGHLSIEQTELQADVLERYIDIRAGEPFDPERLIDLQILLSDLDYFASVELDVDRSQAVDGVLPVRVITTPRPRQKWVFGLGYGTDTGPRARAGVELRRLNSRGHRIRSELRIAEIKSSATGVYEIPVGTRAGEMLALSGEVVQEQIGEGLTQETVVGLSRNKLHKGWLRRMYINLEREDFELGATRETSNLFIPGISYSRSFSNDPLFARRGWSLFFDLRGAHEALFSTTSFSRWRAEYRGIWPLAETMRLLARVELGWLLSEEFSDLPPTQRFFAGGDRSIRGYGYQSVGPTDSTGEVIGGRYLGVGSVEVDWLFWGNIGAAAFFDLGSAADEPADDLRRGLGLGLRWRTPVGMLRLDLAHPLDDDERNLRLHVGIGAEL